MNDVLQAEPQWVGFYEQTVDMVVPQSELYSAPLRITYAVAPVSPQTSDTGMFDWFEVRYRRALVAESDRLLFTPAQAGTYTYRINNFSTRFIDVAQV